MNDVKPWYMSSTIWGVIISLLGLANQIYMTNTGHILLSSDDLNNLVSITMQLIGSLVAIYGRLNATKTIQ